jgi:hypothetical protein
MSEILTNQPSTARETTVQTTVSYHLRNMREAFSRASLAVALIGAGCGPSVRFEVETSGTPKSTLLREDENGNKIFTYYAGEDNPTPTVVPLGPNQRRTTCDTACNKIIMDNDGACLASPTRRGTIPGGTVVEIAIHPSLGVSRRCNKERVISPVVKLGAAEQQNVECWVPEGDLED